MDLSIGGGEGLGEVADLPPHDRRGEWGGVGNGKWGDRRLKFWRSEDAFRGFDAEKDVIFDGLGSDFIDERLDIVESGVGFCIFCGGRFMRAFVFWGMGGAILVDRFRNGRKRGEGVFVVVEVDLDIDLELDAFIIY